MLVVVDSKKKHSAPRLLSNQSLTGPQKVLQQVELQSSTALTFPNTTSSTTSGGTILATANFTGSGNFSVVALPTVTSSNNCGVFTSPLLRLAVLVASVDATVSPFSPTGLRHTETLARLCDAARCAFLNVISLFASYGGSPGFAKLIPLAALPCDDQLVLLKLSQHQLAFLL